MTDYNSFIKKMSEEIYPEECDEQQKKLKYKVKEENEDGS